MPTLRFLKCPFLIFFRLSVRSLPQFDPLFDFVFVPSRPTLNSILSSIRSLPTFTLRFRCSRLFTLISLWVSNLSSISLTPKVRKITPLVFVQTKVSSLSCFRSHLAFWFSFASKLVVVHESSVMVCFTLSLGCFSISIDPHKCLFVRFTPPFIISDGVSKIQALISISLKVRAYMMLTLISWLYNKILSLYITIISKIFELYNFTNWI